MTGWTGGGRGGGVGGRRGGGGGGEAEVGEGLLVGAGALVEDGAVDLERWEGVSIREAPQGGDVGGGGDEDI